MASASRSVPAALAILAALSLVVFFALVTTCEDGDPFATEPTESDAAEPVHDAATPPGTEPARRRAAPPAPDVAGAPLPARLRFVVTSADGTVVEGARIEVRGDDAWVAETTSDAEGRASVDAPTGDVSVGVRKIGFRPWSLNASTSGPGEVLHRVTLEPAAAVRVRVLRDADAAPVADANVRLAPGMFGPSGEPQPKGGLLDAARTDSSGVALLLGASPRGVAVVVAVVPGYVSGVEIVEPADTGTVEVEVRLVASGVLDGVVLDADDRPARRTVNVRAAGAARAERLNSVRSLEDGTFRIGGLALDGTYELAVCDTSGREMSIVCPLRPTPPESARAIVVRVPRAARLTVQAGAGAAPDAPPSDDDAEPSEVRIVRLAEPPDRDPLAIVALDTPIELPPGRYVVRVLPSGAAPGGETVVDLAGGGVAGVRVVAARVGSDESSETTTDAAGAFLFPCVGGGTWTVEAQDDRGREASPVWVDVPGAQAPPSDAPPRAGERPRAGPVTLTLGPPAEFLVRFPPGVAGRDNWLRFDRRLPPGAEDSDGETPDGWTGEGGLGTGGSLEEDWGPCAPGRWRIYARIAGFRPWTTEVDLAHGERRVIDLGPLDPAVTVAGVVVDPEGGPVEGARVSVVDGTWDSIGRASKADGRFGPVAVAPGRAILAIDAPGFPTTRVALNAVPGMPDVRLVLRPGGVATIRVLRPGGSGVPSLPVTVVAADGASAGTSMDTEWFGDALVTDARGVCRVRAAPGTYRLRVGATPAVEVEVRIEEGRLTDWTVELP